MQVIEAYRTSDGEIFTEHRQALKHLDEKMGALITLHAGRMVQIDKYSAMIDYLLENLDQLAEAREWQKELEEAKSL